jgi:hypothetical protein
MARMVTHYSECGNFYDYYQEHDERPKTLCNREMTWRYRFTSEVERVTCSRCKKTLEKRQMMPGQANGAVVRITTARDIGSCGDEKVDLYLERLGIG